MSTYSFVIIFLISLGGTELKPGKSPRTAGAPGVVGAGVDTTAGHAGRADGPEAAPPPAEDMANMGNKTSEPARGAKKEASALADTRGAVPEHVSVRVGKSRPLSSCYPHEG